MTPKHFYVLLVAFVAICSATAQSEDELQIPVENDNQFPPDKHSDIIEGSGFGVIEEPEVSISTTTEAVPPSIEHFEPKTLLDELGTRTASGDDDLCPKPCVCHVEGTSNDFIVDCSGYDLTEFPAPINDKTTVLNIHHNKLTEIPKEISALKKLRILNANDNRITKLASGSVSELPALVALNLRNNRLIEYPIDLKNGFGLAQLEELDLGGNDMRTIFTSSLFSQFSSLRKVILPTSTAELQQDLCDALPSSLEIICTESCENLFECRDGGDDKIDEDLPVLPGMLIFSNEEEDNADPVVNTPIGSTGTQDNADSNTAANKDSSVNSNRSTASTSSPTLIENAKTQVDADSDMPANNDSPIDAHKPKANSAPAEFSFRSAVNKQPDVAPFNSIVEAPKDTQSSSETPIKVGATTSDTKTGGVDKSIIGLVVAGMVVIVAGITIKKNWSSIKKRFSSNSRTPNERNGISANGAAPEEVPLQDKDKSPV